MKLETRALKNCIHTLLAHSYRGENLHLRKGILLESSHLEQLANEAVESLVVAVIEKEDVLEDEAAIALSQNIQGANIEVSAVTAGRVNFRAIEDGILYYSYEQVMLFNQVNWRITLAIKPPFSRVSAGEIFATVKIIPFAVPGNFLQAAIHLSPKISMLPFTPKKAIMIHTLLASEVGVKEEVTLKQQHHLAEVTQKRFSSMHGNLIQIEHSLHDVNGLTEKILMLDGMDHDFLLIGGASAICDEQDVIPSAIEKSGGKVIHIGMPVDPGNLLVLGYRQGVWIIGLPGCAKSPNMNGLDWVLERLCANLPLTSQDIMRMGVGGLLKDTEKRPMPRELI